MAMTIIRFFFTIFCLLFFVNVNAQNIANSNLLNAVGFKNKLEQNSNSDEVINKLGKVRKIKKHYLTASDIKIDIYGPLRGYSQITFEKENGLFKGYEFTLGIIGAGLNKHFEYPDTTFTLGKNRKGQFGFFLAAGYKFYKIPIFETYTRKQVNQLQGAYIRPTLYFGHYKENRIAYKINSIYKEERPFTTFLALQAEFGKQWVVTNKWLIDIYWGLGYSIDDKKYYNTSYFEQNTISAYNYCNNRLGRSPGISFTVGLKTGLLIK